MRHLNKDDKIFLTALFVFTFALGALVCSIVTTIRLKNSVVKKYDMYCVTRYVKKPFQECQIKEVKK